MGARRPRNSPTSARYRAGAAARLVGLRVDTLRAWERRYGVVAPDASAGGHRLYSPEDVTRLALLKQVVDLGHSIGSVAKLSAAELRGLRDAAGGPIAASTPNRAVRVAAVGPSLAARFGARGSSLFGVELLAAGDDLETTRAALRDRAVDSALVDLPVLDADAAATADALTAALGVRALVILYRFGPQAVVRALRARRHVVARAPVDDVEIAALCSQAAPEVARRNGGVTMLSLAEPPPPRYSDAALARLVQAPAAMLCECPRHVSELLTSLAAFERYSSQCEARNPADAALHDHLRRAAGTARQVMEEALAKLAELEGFDLGEARAESNAASPRRRRSG
jgi:DNA-binding transcriptional MerR regulator